ncbi:MAG: alanine--tRNA ligase [Gammaproteobacteria bacterium]|nr:alanine--tRNA ligase [Gammaproteobacteria bacterium]
MNAAELRKAFLDYFAAQGHRIVPSSPLVPGNDPTLLFTNAGMVQFKDCFLGSDVRNYVRATSSQRCVRAGGKHNDLENVGYTARHHTFFEMLGNFSFGDYFKQDAIAFAWHFLTQELGIPEERLWVTVYKDDDETADIWLNDVGVSAERFSRLGEQDNFWSMGDVGPCGPCTEIFYDHGEAISGGPPGSPDEDGDRYVEVWNLVFMQFERSADGTLTPLPKPSVDTGMGLERIAAVMQGVHSNYDIDLFQALIKSAAKITKTKDLSNNSLKVIADHIRAASFLIIDGVLPGNEGRGYVLRRIIRRALRHGYELNTKGLFFYKLYAALREQMGDAYPELATNEDHVIRVLRTEEERFAETLSQGMGILEEAIEQLQGTELGGETVFKLYDTYGFPADLTADVARNRNLTIDQPGFEAAMQAQRERARSASKFSVVDGGVQVEGKTAFIGYDNSESQARITALLCDGKSVESLAPGQIGQVVLDTTPFYAESGGQVGDTGALHAHGAVFRVEDTVKNSEAFVHVGVLESGSLSVGDSVSAQINEAERSATALNHSATHIVHAALREVLGKHVTQKGSLVNPSRLRFDFSHYEGLTDDELLRIENLVNEQIRLNEPVKTQLMTPEQATEAGAMALFGEKYGDEVRVLRIGDFSMELCGGTHAHRAGDIGLFKILSESGIASGVRRIEAVTGTAAVDAVRETEQTLFRIGVLLKATPADVEAKVGQVLARNREQEKELKSLRAQLASGSSNDKMVATDIAGINVLAQQLADDIDADTLRQTLDNIKDKLGNAAVVLASVTAEGKVRLAAGVSKDATSRIRAGDLVNHVAHQVGGKGGGRPDFAQAGGTEAHNLAAALQSVPDWVAQQLSQ